MYQKLRSDDAQLLRYAVQQTDGGMDGGTDVGQTNRQKKWHIEVGAPPNNNYKLKLHSHINYLGILIDEVMSWKNQLESICMKVARANYILSKLCYFVPKDICILVYYF